MVYCCIIWSRRHFGLHYLKPFSTFIITSGLFLFYCGYIYTHLKLQNNHLLHSNSSFFIIFTYIYILTFTSYIQNHTFNHETKTFNKQTSHFHYLQLWIDCPLPILSIYIDFSRDNTEGAQFKPTLFFFLFVLFIYLSTCPY